MTNEGQIPARITPPETQRSTEPVSGKQTHPQPRPQAPEIQSDQPRVVQMTQAQAQRPDQKPVVSDKTQITGPVTPAKIRAELGTKPNAETLSAEIDNINSANQE